jgi:hypothetical protein
MRPRLPGCRVGQTCACGALVKDGRDACDKCISRSRWSRHKARRGYDA